VTGRSIALFIAAAVAEIGGVLAAYGGVFIISSLLWGIVFDGFRPDRYDIAGATVCLVGVAVIMYAPRGAG
jgi:small multidrug resistance family-3 protein